MNRKFEDYEKDQKKFMIEKEKELNEVKMKNYELEKRNSEYEVKYKDLFRELELLKSNTKFGGMNMQESLVNNELENRLQQKENELEDRKKEFELMERHFTDERNNLKEKLNVMQDKLLEMKTVNAENEKLKLRIKELLPFKEKCFDYDNLLISLEARNKQIENLNNEKKKMLETIEKVQKDMNFEKEKFRQLEYEKKKMEFEFNDIRKDMSRMETQLKKKEITVNP
jgi:chromosome segregation ATPase